MVELIKQNLTSDNLTKVEKGLVQSILNETYKKNLDNISRTEAYFDFYKQHKEIPWSFLAHMVSRNAGWNMCDLEGKWFPHLLSSKKRECLYKTYERANWIIFQDAYPQLLLYHYTTKKKQPMFHLLKFFHVSSFMEKEWNYFWKHQDVNRLMISLIVNEQHVIQNPVICHPYLQKHVFHSLIFLLQDRFHFSSVLLPTCNGNLYGSSISGFMDVDKRIDLGKRVAKILFDEQLYPFFYQFASNTVHTGSRYDYERYFMLKKARDTPILRVAFPIVEHHIHHYEDWSKNKKYKRAWYKETNHKHSIVLDDWFIYKQKQLQKLVFLKKIIE